MKKLFIVALILVSSATVFAAKEMNISYDSGGTVYVIIRDHSDNKVWNITAFETWSEPNIIPYGLALNDREGDYYEVDFPAGITNAGTYILNYYVQSGGDPNGGDTLIGSDSIIWTGTSETVASSTDAIADAVWDEAAADHVTAGTTGEKMSFLKNLWRGLWR